MNLRIAPVNVQLVPSLKERWDITIRLIIPREDLQGLENATPRQLAEIQLWGGGISLSWPQLDVDHYLPHLLEHRYGSDAWMEKLRVRGVAA